LGKHGNYCEHQDAKVIAKGAVLPWYIGSQLFPSMYIKGTITIATE